MARQVQINGLIGESSVFQNMLTAISKIAGYDATVLISGETGSGKELAARAIHYQGKRSDKPFIPVNCGALPDHLIENELFGHCKGAYTDARDTQTGLIAQAEGGTLFLDEVDALSPKAQVSLLRFLQDGKYRQLGGSRLEAADAGQSGAISRRSALPPQRRGTACAAASRARGRRDHAGATFYRRRGLPLQHEPP